MRPETEGASMLFRLNPSGPRDWPTCGAPVGRRQRAKAKTVSLNVVATKTDSPAYCDRLILLYYN